MLIVCVVLHYSKSLIKFSAFGIQKITCHPKIHIKSKFIMKIVEICRFDHRYLKSNLNEVSIDHKFAAINTSILNFFLRRRFHRSMWCRIFQSLKHFKLKQHAFCLNYFRSINTKGLLQYEGISNENHLFELEMNAYFASGNKSCYFDYYFFLATILLMKHFRCNLIFPKCAIIMKQIKKLIAFAECGIRVDENYIRQHKKSWIANLECKHYNENYTRKFLLNGFRSFSPFANRFLIGWLNSYP